MLAGAPNRLGADVDLSDGPPNKLDPVDGFSVGPPNKFDAVEGFSEDPPNRLGPVVGFSEGPPNRLLPPACVPKEGALNPCAVACLGSGVFRTSEKLKGLVDGAVDVFEAVFANSEGAAVPDSCGGPFPNRLEKLVFGFSVAPPIPPKRLLEDVLGAPKRLVVAGLPVCWGCPKMFEEGGLAASPDIPSKLLPGALKAKTGPLGDFEPEGPPALALSNEKDMVSLFVDDFCANGALRGVFVLETRH